MSKKKPPTQPQKSKINKPEDLNLGSVSINIEEVEPVKQEEVYVPSQNADKYPAPEPSTVQYKILAFRNDYVKLQEEVTKLLQEGGWQLSGGISTSMTVSPYESVTLFAQALVKY